MHTECLWITWLIWLFHIHMTTSITIFEYHMSFLFFTLFVAITKYIKPMSSSIDMTASSIQPDLICYHYNDVIMGALAFQITSLTIVYSTVYSRADHRPANSPHKGPVTRKMFPFDDAAMSSFFFWLISLSFQKKYGVIDYSTWFVNCPKIT